MRKLLTTALLAFLALSMTGCGWWDRIPPAHKGKVLTGSGYQSEVLDPGRKFVWSWQKMMLLDVSTQTFKEDLTVILHDRLELDFSVLFRASLRS
jgi:outer membrane lipopolysaccharide assembly protein LptE/RlpB